MKLKSLLRIFIFLALFVGIFNSGSQVNAQAPQIVIRGLSYWDAIYIGNVSSTRYENWPFTFDAEYSFSITATTTSGDLVPQLTLFDLNGNEISTTINVLSSTQPAGNYSVQIQPASGSGTYSLTIRQVAAPATATPTNAPVFTDTPTPFNTPLPTDTPAPTNTPVFTNTPTDVPTETATAVPSSVPSATPTETLVFTPTAAATSTPTSAYVTTDLTPATIVQGGTSTATVNLNNVPPSGFSSAEFTCTFDPALVSVSNIAATNLFGADPVVAINGPQNGSFIVAIAGSNGNEATTSGAAFTFTVTGSQIGQSAVDCQARVSTGNLSLVTIPSSPATLTTTSSQGAFAGQVLASKPVTVTLYNPDTSVAGTVAANPDGTFNLSVSPGTYTAIATSSGHLKAQGSVTVTSGNTTTFQSITLLAGDIDGNDVIDQFDALTIGINYNAATPTEADLNNDGTINVLDMEILAGNYREAGALVWQ